MFQSTSGGAERHDLEEVAPPPGQIIPLEGDVSNQSLFSMNPQVGIVMGSDSDWPLMKKCAEKLKEFGVPFEARILSAHRTPDAALAYAATAKERGIRVLIGAAGGAAHLAGVLASKTELPVLAVPMPSKHLQGLDSLLSMVQMPAGIPVATLAIGEAGAVNAALFSISLLALGDPGLAKKLADFRRRQTEKVLAKTLPDQP